MARIEMRNLFLSLFILSVSAGLSTRSIEAQQPSKPPIWSPDAAALDQLSAAESVDNFVVRLPKGYRHLRQTGPDGAIIYAWAGAKRSDGTMPQFLIMTLSPEGEVRQADMEPGLAAMLQSFKVEKKDWRQSPFERGVINGLPFVRTRWEGFEISLQRKLFGFAYLTIVDKKVILISSQDVEPFQTLTLALAEAATQTFRKR